jgi:ABC-type Na+ transport system ATPase subunit NatA
VLEIRNLSKRFGGLAAVNDVTVTIEKGKVNAIIGPNGAGKTTFFNLIAVTSAFLKPSVPLIDIAVRFSASTRDARSLRESSAMRRSAGMPARAISASAKRRGIHSARRLRTPRLPE